MGSIRPSLPLKRSRSLKDYFPKVYINHAQKIYIFTNNNKIMKKTISAHGVTLLLLFLTTFICACSIGQQAKEIKTLADCKYTITSVEDIYISGTNIEKLIDDQDINLTNIPSLALGFLSKNIPLRANLHVAIDNPTDNAASINYFDY